MSILEPRPTFDTEDPLLDAVLGLYSYAQRARATIEQLTPEPRASANSRDASLEALPEPIVAFLLGIVSTCDSLERVVDDACPPIAAPSRSRPAPTHGSLWR